MAERRIVIYGDPVLREVSRPVEEVNQEIKDLVSDMVDTVKQARGLGLAAVQVGVAKRIFIVDFSAIDINGSLMVFINPEILEASGQVEMEEGCLSFPEIYQKITRPARVRIRALDGNGRPFELTAEGLPGRAILHEFDHLEGRLIIDHITPIARTLLRGRLRKLAAAS